jgi:alkanesulfonate monooxygenase SsuD/methylene tetrahydromethanopterin reductase-like flavin-dependent oxidoreductase (luciferase family)
MTGTWNRWPLSDRSMEFSVILPMAEMENASERTMRFADLLELTLAAEAAGLDAVWLPDHFLFRAPVAPGDEEFGAWEAFTTAAALCQATSRIQVGLLVTCLGWRNPGIVARMTETIEEISGGRFVLGIGAGWHQPEYDAYGMPFDHRASRFEDALVILDGLIRTGRSSHAGQFFQTVDAISQPRGPRAGQGGPPILVGSRGERVLRLTARYADAWNSAWHATAEKAQPDVERLRAACAEVGRDPDSIVMTVGGDLALGPTWLEGTDPLRGTDDEILSELRRFRDLGFRHYVAAMDPVTPELVRHLGRIADTFNS